MIYDMHCHLLPRVDDGSEDNTEDVVRGIGDGADKRDASHGRFRRH